VKTTKLPVLKKLRKQLKNPEKFVKFFKIGKTEVAAKDI